MESNKENGSKSNKQTLLKRAEEQFLKSNYIDALKIYSLILKDYPHLKDAKIGVYLSDMGLESDEDAQALFDYYQILKNTRENPESVIDELIQAIYNTRFMVEETFRDILEDIESSEGISYEDFLKLVESKGDFKKALEDTMFSTKVVIKTKDEFIDFIKNLIKSGHKEIALSYLDSLAENFNKDQDIYKLYNLVNEMDKDED